MKIIRRVFDDCQSFWDYIEKPLKNCISENPSSQDKTRPNWHKTASFEEALKFSRDGWALGLEKIKPLSAELKSVLGTPAGVDLNPVYDVVGESPDVGLFLTGDPEHMIRFEQRESDRNRIIKIGCCVTTSGGLEDGVIENRGALICALIDWLEGSGYRCEVSALWAVEVHENNIEHHVSVNLKQAQESLNMDRLSFALVNPSMQRRFMFKCMEMESPKDQEALNVLGGYGHVGTSPKDLQGDIYLPSMMSGSEWDSKEKCVKMAKELLSNIGLEIKQEA